MSLVICMTSDSMLLKRRSGSRSQAVAVAGEGGGLHADRREKLSGAVRNEMNPQQAEGLEDEAPLGASEAPDDSGQAAPRARDVVLGLQVKEEHAEVQFGSEVGLEWRHVSWGCRDTIMRKHYSVSVFRTVIEACTAFRLLTGFYASL